MLYKQDSITMADNFGGSENIYYEDNSNIVLIDPNSVRDSNGVKKDRVIKQENLVMYANLEANAVPRTRLAVGQDVESSINNTTPGLNLGGKPSRMTLGSRDKVTGVSRISTYVVNNP